MEPLMDRRFTAGCAFLIALSIVTGLAPVAIAGTVCGTVRDAQTLQPIPNAAVFLFDHLDQYTGLYTGTDPGGQYCILNIPSGTYTIQVRVDDYIAAVVRDIVVDNATSVDITTSPRFFLDQPWPNPAANRIFFRMGATSETVVSLEVFDVRGRLVAGWTGNGPGSAGRTVEWNLQDLEHNDVPSGVYFARLRSDGHEVVRRFVRLR
jgi:hypothetical protein